MKYINPSFRYSVINFFTNLKIRGSDRLANIACALELMKIDVTGLKGEVLKGRGAILPTPSAPGLVVKYKNLPRDIDGRIPCLYDFARTVNNYCILKLKYGMKNISKLSDNKRAKDLPHKGNFFCFFTDRIKIHPFNLIAV